MTASSLTVERARAFAFSMGLGGGRTLRLQDFGGPVVLALYATGGGFELSEKVFDRVRAELRRLGARMVSVSREGAWCFRPDDELEWLASAKELSDKQLAALFAGYGLEWTSTPRGGKSSGLFVIDDEHRIRFQMLGVGGDLADVACALESAGHALDERTRSTVSRREILISSLVAGFTLVLLDGCGGGRPARRVEEPAGSSPAAGTEIDIALNVNGEVHRLKVEPRVTLLDALRERLGLTGTKKGCDQGQCGACTVLVDGRRINACLTLAVMVDSAKIVTIEGLAEGDRLHPVQQAFIAEDAFQCGFCTPGQIMSAVGLLREKRAAAAAEIREHMSGNICRCGAYPNIVAAIQSAARGTSA